MRRVALSPASMRYGVPFTTSRFEDCVRSAWGSGPPAVPRVTMTVSASTQLVASEKHSAASEMAFVFFIGYSFGTFAYSLFKRHLRVLYHLRPLRDLFARMRRAFLGRGRGGLDGLLRQALAQIRRIERFDDQRVQRVHHRARRFRRREEAEPHADFEA